MGAALDAWNAMIDLVGATIDASERIAAAQPAPAEPDRWLATLEAITETLLSVVSHTRAPGISRDDLIVVQSNLRQAFHNLRLAREHYAAYQAHERYMQGGGGDDENRP
ncbi:MAG TPA: hypothetical protein VGQ92_22410 [Actinoplanes sp.]|jgi:hypothetical protein|nr:hypothetical protein [Actinoplanes sp.]